MNKQPIRAEKITKPIQLLAAWLAGLFAIDSCFLFAASSMEQGSWESLTLVIASIINVPMFLSAVFILQTRFRPELQEDQYYSSYLSRKTNEIISVNQSEHQFMELRQLISDIKIDKNEKSEAVGFDLFSDLSVGVNKHVKNRVMINQKLIEAGFFGYREFGSHKVPPHNVVAISQYLDKHIRKEVVNFSKGIGFTEFSLFDAIAEQTDEDILIGAYGKPDFKVG